MEIWKKWVPSEDFPPTFDVESLADKDGVITLILGSKNPKKAIRVIFEDTVFSYKSTREIAFLKTLDDLHEKHGEAFYVGWSLFNVENSGYLQWFQQESLMVYESQNIEHYVFYTTEDVIEILSFCQPKIEIQDAL